MNIRLFALLTAIALLVTLSACSGNAPEATVITKNPNTSTTVTTAPVGTTTSTTPSQSEPTTPSETDTTTTLPTVGTADGNSETGDAIATLAISLVGTPFKNGGNGPAEFDNPGFVKYCYKQSGYTVPRKAAQMTEYGAEVNDEEIQPGDILIFCNEIGEEAGFVGIYIGNNQFVASTNPTAGTKIHKLDVSYWGPRFICARRFV